MTLTTQFSTLLAMTVTGLGMAWVFDLYTWFREKLRVQKIFTFLFDVTYWVVFALAVLLVLYNVNEGKLRITLFFAILIGGLFYFQFLSRPFLRVWDGIVAMIMRIVRFILHVLNVLIVKPLIWLFTTLFAAITWIGTGLWKVIRTIFGWIGRPILSIIKKLRDSTIALIRKIGKMIVQVWKRKPRDE